MFQKFMDQIGKGRTEGPSIEELRGIFEDPGALAGMMSLLESFDVFNTSVARSWDSGSFREKSAVINSLIRMANSHSRKRLQVHDVKLLGTIKSIFGVVDFSDLALFDVQMEGLKLMEILWADASENARLDMISILTNHALSYLSFFNAKSDDSSGRLRARKTAETAVLQLCKTLETPTEMNHLLRLQGQKALVACALSPDFELREAASKTLFRVSAKGTFREQFLNDNDYLTAIFLGLRSPNFETRAAAFSSVDFQYCQERHSRAPMGRHSVMTMLGMVENVTKYRDIFETMPLGGSVWQGMMYMMQHSAEAASQALKHGHFATAGTFLVEYILKCELVGIMEQCTSLQTASPKKFATFAQLSDFCAQEIEKSTTSGMAWQSGILKIKNALNDGDYLLAHKLAEQYYAEFPEVSYFSYARCVQEQSLETIMVWGPRCLAAEGCELYLKCNTLEWMGDRHLEKGFFQWINKEADDQRLLEAALSYYHRSHASMPLDHRMKRRLVIKMVLLSLVVCNPQTFSISQLETLIREISKMDEFWESFWGSWQDNYTDVYDLISSHLPLFKKAEKLLATEFPKMKMPWHSIEKPKFQNPPFHPFTVVKANPSPFPSRPSSVSSTPSTAKSTDSPTPPISEWSVSKLKSFLTEAGVDISKCVEKSELVEKVQQLQKSTDSPLSTPGGKSQRLKKCANCGKTSGESTTLKMCGACKEAKREDAPRYCGTECQRGHWQAHKVVCAKNKTKQ